jgi:nucleoid DNA-binding protein
MLSVGRMKKRELAQHVAETKGVAPGTAADQMDQVVNELVRALKSGQAARLPGLGTIKPGKRWVFRRESGER